MRVYAFETLDSLEEIYKNLLEEDYDTNSCDTTIERLQAIGLLIVLHKTNQHMLDEYRNKVKEEDIIYEELQKITKIYYKKKNENYKYESKLCEQIGEVMKKDFPDIFEQVEL